MRIGSWVFVACAVLAAIGLFLPAIEADVSGRFAQHASLSLHQAASDRELARRLLAAYRASHDQHVGMEVISALDPHARGRTRAALDDAHDAMDTLRGISDNDAKTIGTAVAASIWLYLALQILMAGLVFVQVVAGRYRRGRLIAALVISIVGAAMAGAMFYACKRVAFEVNDEVSAQIVKVGPGAIVIPIAASAAMLCAIALVALHVRAARR